MNKIRELFNLLETLLKHKVNLNLLVLIVIAIISSDFNEISLSNCGIDENINANEAESENQKSKWSWTDIGLTIAGITIALALIIIVKEFFNSIENPIDTSESSNESSSSESEVELKRTNIKYNIATQPESIKENVSNDLPAVPTSEHIEAMIKGYGLLSIVNLTDQTTYDAIIKLMQDYLQMAIYQANGHPIYPGMVFNSLTSHLPSPLATSPIIALFFDTLAKCNKDFVSLNCSIKAFQVMAENNEFTHDTIIDTATFASYRQIFRTKTP